MAFRLAGTFIGGAPDSPVETALSTGKTIVDSYVVRIYRRIAPRDEGSGTLVGLVEDVYAGSERHLFYSISELWDILGAGAHRSQHPPSTHGGHSS